MFGYAGPHGYKRGIGYVPPPTSEPGPQSSPLITALGTDVPENTTQQFGWTFTALEDMTAARLRIRLGSPATVVVRLWRVGQDDIWFADSFAYAGPGWQEFEASGGITLAEGQTYALTVRGVGGASYDALTSFDNSYDPRITHIGMALTDSEDYPSNQFGSAYVAGTADLLIDD